MVIIGHRFSKSTFGANNFHSVPICWWSSLDCDHMKSENSFWQILPSPNANATLLSNFQKLAVAKIISMITLKVSFPFLEFKVTFTKEEQANKLQWLTEPPLHNIKKVQKDERLKQKVIFTLEWLKFEKRNDIEKKFAILDTVHTTDPHKGEQDNRRHTHRITNKGGRCTL